MPWWAEMIITLTSIIFAGGTGYGGAKLHNIKKTKKGSDVVLKAEFEELKNRVQHIENKLSKIDGKLDIIVTVVTKKEGN